MWTGSQESHVRLRACTRLRLAVGDEVTELERRAERGMSAAGVYDGTERRNVKAAWGSWLQWMYLHR